MSDLVAPAMAVSDTTTKPSAAPTIQRSIRGPLNDLRRLGWIASSIDRLPTDDELIASSSFPLQASS
jgi:hypothetical protein